MDDDELAFIAGLAMQGAGVAQPESGALVVAQEEVGHGDLQLAELQPPARRHAQRSWQHAQVARHGKQVKRLKVAAAAAEQRAESAESTTRVLAAVAPTAARSLGVCRRKLSPEERALALLCLAFQPTKRGAGSERQSQAWAAFVVASHLMTLQKGWFDKWFLRVSAAMAGDTPCRRIHAFTHQWDETSQRLPGFGRCFAGDEARGASGQTRREVIVQHGQMFRFVVGHRAPLECRQEPFFFKAGVVENTKANTLLEAIIRQYPIDVTNVAEFHHLVSRCRVLLLCWGCDRAASNIVVVRWFFQMIERCSPVQVLPHAEPCNAHGAALAKSRVRASARITGALVSFAKLLRDGKTALALRQSVASLIAERLEIRRERRPQAHKDRADQLMQVLLGGEARGNLRRSGLEGEQTKSRFIARAEEFLAMFGPDIGSTRMVHWCFAEETSTEHLHEGVRVGAPCCPDKASAIEKMTVCALEFLFGSAWPVACASRWVHVAQLRARFLAAALCSRLLPESLKELRAHWGLSTAVIPTLQRMVAADQLDFSSKGKLKLLRVCQALCDPLVIVDMLATHVVESIIDDIMYGILGRQKEKARLLDLIRPTSSPIVLAQAQVCQLMVEWGPESQHWKLLARMGACMADPGLRHKVRVLLLQAHVGLVEYFGLRFGAPPYSLGALCDPAASAALKAKVVDGLFKSPAPCLPLFARRLQQLFATREDILASAPSVIESWAIAAPVGVDWCERAHAQMRTDLRSDGPARSATASANRCFCRQAAASQADRGGHDLHQVGRRKLASLVAPAGAGLSVVP